jgi:hypothetical protein
MGAVANQEVLLLRAGAQAEPGQSWGRDWRPQPELGNEEDFKEDGGQKTGREVLIGKG